MTKTFDATADFNLAGNPNGPWKYGYAKGLAQGSAFIAFDNTSQNAAALSPGFGWTKTGYNPSGTPVIWINKAAQMRYGVPSGSLSLHPGPAANNDYTILRFTVPETGTYQIQGSFYAGDIGHMDGTIAVDGNVGPPLRYFSECLDNSSFNIGPIPLNAGQTIDFAVGNKGNYACGNTPIRVQIMELAANQPGGDLNQYVDSLGRLPPVLLTQSGAENGTDVAGSVDTVTTDTGVRVLQQRKRTIEAITSQSYMDDVAMENVWPGEVLQGRAILSSDTAAVGPLPRMPGTITITTALNVDNPGPQFVRVDQPSDASISQAHIDLLNALHVRDSNGALKGRFTSASTLNEVGVRANLSIKGSTFGADANASLNTSFKNTTVVAVIRQEFYTVAFAPDSAGASGFWQSSVQPADLAPYMGSGNPPLYVESVTYGRLIVVCATSAHSSSDLAAAMNAHYKSGNVSGTVGAGLTVKQIIDSSDVSVYTMGVPGHLSFERLNDAADELSDIYKSGRVFDIANPGAPIAFTCRHVADNTVARRSLVAEYTQILSAQADNVEGLVRYVWDGTRGGLVETGIRVNPGDQVKIAASGYIYGGLFYGLIGPEGWRGSKGDSGYPAPDLPRYSLIARFGQGDWIEVGGHWEGQPPNNAGGSLQLNLNDDNPYNGGTDRQWTVVIDVVRGNAAAAGVYI